MKLIVINVRVPEETDKFLRKRAKERVVSKAVVVRDILRDHVEASKLLQQTMAAEVRS